MDKNTIKKIKTILQAILEKHCYPFEYSKLEQELETVIELLEEDKKIINQ